MRYCSSPSIRILRIGAAFLGLVTWVLAFQRWSASLDPYVRKRMEEVSVLQLYVFGSGMIVEGELDHFCMTRTKDRESRYRIRKSLSIWCTQPITC